MRFKIGDLLVNTFIPFHMMNNTAPALVAIAMTTILGHNYTPIVSGGVSVVNIFPCAWLYSTLPNTGKTTALNIGQACMGTHYIMTAGSTIPHARVRGGQGGGCSNVVLDDFPISSNDQFLTFIRSVAGDGDEGRVNKIGARQQDENVRRQAPVGLRVLGTSNYSPIIYSPPPNMIRPLFVEHWRLYFYSVIHMNLLV